LISLSKQIKDISEGSLDDRKYESPSPKKKYSYLENVIRSSEVANKNNLKNYLEQKKLSKTNNQTMNVNFSEPQPLSRTETNHSNLLS